MSVGFTSAQLLRMLRWVAALTERRRRAMLLIKIGEFSDATCRESKCY